MRRVSSAWERRAPVSRHGSCHPVHRALSGFDRLSPRPQRPDRHRHGQHRADHRRAVHPSRLPRPQAEHAGRMGVRTAGDKGAVPGRQVTLVPAARCAATVSTAGERADGRERQAARSDPEAAASCDAQARRPDSPRPASCLLSRRSASSRRSTVSVRCRGSSSSGGRRQRRQRSRLAPRH